MGDKTVYIHYGHDEFRLPDPIVNEVYFTKPKGGLWASRKNGKMTWKTWCKQEEFRLDSFENSFEFTLKDNARVLELNSENQLDCLPKLNEGGYKKEDRYSTCYLDFEALRKQYDAIEVTDIARLYWKLYGWDCNSILIMNPGIVEVVGDSECNKTKEAASTKLFVATIPNSECDRLVERMYSMFEVIYLCDRKLLPEERDANYYMIDFGEEKHSAEVNQKRITGGPNGLGRLLSDIGRSVYGLYRTDILCDDTTLDEYIERVTA